MSIQSVNLSINYYTGSYGGPVLELEITDELGQTTTSHIDLADLKRALDGL